MSRLVLVSVGLALICRDNAAVIERCLLSTIPQIDTWTIVDTGSTDETPEIVKATLSDVEGTLYRRDWVNSGHNRTELLALAKGTADYLLLLDADHELKVETELPTLTADAYMLHESQNGLTWRMPRLIRGDREWRYGGVAHEYLEDAERRENLDAWWVIHHGDGRSSEDKLTVALAELEASFAVDPFDSRTVFYIAQTNRQLGNVDEAIFYYRLRCEMGGWDEEVYYARYQLGCLLAANVSFAQGADELLQAWKERPGRIEALRALANSANAVADKAATPDDVLFVHREMYVD